MMKKKLALVLAMAMTASLALTGCGNGGDSGSGSGAASGSGAGSSAPAPAEKTTQVLATGGTTGTYYGVGSAMMNVLNPLLTLTELNVRVSRGVQGQRRGHHRRRVWPGHPSV